MLDRLNDALESLDGKVGTLTLDNVKRIVEFVEETQLSGEFIAQVLVDEIKKGIIPAKEKSSVHPVSCDECKVIMYECDVVEGAIYEKEDDEFDISNCPGCKKMLILG